MRLSHNFSLEELIASDTALRLCIDNTPSSDIEAALAVTALGMEKVRTLLNDNPIHISSGYRCPMLNRAINGAKDSAHMYGTAVDFTCSTWGSPLQIVRYLAGSDLMFDQLIQEGNWIHISFDPRMRRRVLTAHFGHGGTTYTQGA